MTVDLPFPVLGVEETRSYSRQRPGTCAQAMNVRGYNPENGRLQGAVRGGLAKYMSAVAVTAGYPIQHMTSLVTTDVDDIALSKVGYSTYVLAIGDGFGVANASGTSQWTKDSNTFEFGCSCWDDDDKLYVGTINPATGATEFYKYSAAGVIDATFGGGAQVTSITGLAASLRAICGMCVIGDYLYVAARYSAGALGRIHRIHKTTGVVSQSWRTSASIATMLFSTTAVQCLGKVGNLLGVACMATAGGTAQCFKIIDTTKPASTTPISTTLTGGVSIARRTTVRSDGIAFFYVLGDSTTSIIKKIGLGGVTQWASTVFDTDLPQGIAYDFSLGVLIGVTTANATIRQLSLTVGTTVTSASTTAYHWCDSDNHGFFYLYVNGSGAGNDTVQVNSTYSVTWDETRANTTHSGASANKGKEQAPLRAGNAQTRNFAISNGTLVRFTEDGPTTIASGGTSFDARDDARISSSAFENSLYFFTGSAPLIYTATSDSVALMTATAGSLPVDDQGTYPTLSTVFLGRLVLAGLRGDTRTIFFSAAGSPRDFDYSAVVSDTMAWADDLDDVIHALVVARDDVLMVLCDHMIYQFTGDPAAGGKEDVVDKAIGCAWDAWCIGPGSVIYFYGNVGGIWALVPGGSPPRRISQQIEERLKDTDLNASKVSMCWNHDQQCLEVWVTPYDSTENGAKYIWDERNNAWWPEEYSRLEHCPLSVHVIDGPSADDRFILVGGRDGYIRKVTNTEDTDDGRVVNASVTLGPIKTSLVDMTKAWNYMTQLATTSGDVTWSHLVGRTPEEALASTPTKTGTWSAGHENFSWVSRAGFFHYLRLESKPNDVTGLTTRWAHEKTVCAYSTQGEIRRRS